VHLTISFLALCASYKLLTRHYCMARGYGTTRVTLGVVVLTQRVSMLTKYICKFPLHDLFPEHDNELVL
jgi:hypothetical protein